MNKLINIFCFLLSFSLLLSQERLQINKIKVEGNKRFSSEDIIRISKIYPGMEIVSDEIHQGIDKLWNLNRFNDINIIIDSKSDLGGVVTHSNTGSERHSGEAEGEIEGVGGGE